MVSDAHEGLKDAIASVLGGAGWQRRRTRFIRNLLTRAPRTAQWRVAALVRAISPSPTPRPRELSSSA